MKQFFTCLLLLAVGTGLSAQSEKAAQNYLQQNYEQLGLKAGDVADLRVSDAYASPGGVEHVYLAQYHNGIPVNNAQAILHYRGQKLVSKNIGLERDVVANAPAATPAVNAHKAVFNAASEVAPAFGQPIAMAKSGADERFVWPAVSPEPITAQLNYLHTEEGLKLAWRVLIDQHEADAHYYYIMVDANTGDLISKDDLVLHCDFGGGHQHDLAADCRAATPKVTNAATTLGKQSVMDGATYNVIPFGEESPLHGARVLEVNPADANASPFGWHDTNETEGAEFTITRGNNVYAYPDREVGTDNNNSPDAETAEGGAELLFDFPFTPGGNVDGNLSAAMVQSFYTTNKMHDWLYAHGFTESAGNFQNNNYKNGGQPGDEVFAEVMDGSGTNNANFFTPADGGNPRMQMMLFTNNPGLLQGVEPASLMSTFATGEADFGPDVALNGPYEGDVVRAFDASAAPNLMCEAAVNGSDLAGNIALITRGDCFFVDKVLNAQDAGAIAVIICNNVDGLIGMTGNPARQITIPAVSTTTQVCDLFRAELDAGNNVRVKLENQSPPPTASDFDAGIVAHEFGHGVSNRLVGGPSNASCLRNDEQMGEGWSDFFTLASTPLTITDTPDGTEARGIGNYATGSTISGRGIRSQAYSTDLSINDKTYNDVIFTGFEGAPHPLGEVWAATLWDLYWHYVEQDGFDPDLINGTGGNNKAVRLVVEGMKYTACGPGLIDARDGILEANRVVFGGAEQCELYEIFAKRGLGFSATQGTDDNRTDNDEGFDLSPYCDANVQLKKTVDANVIEPGEAVGYTLRAFSYRPEVTENVVITDVIPAGMVLDQATVEGVPSFTLEGDVITFNIGTMAFEDEVVIRYDLTADPTLGSETYFFDGAEDGDDNWSFVNEAGAILWTDTESRAFEGDLAWFVANDEVESDQQLVTFDPILVEGANPALRFLTQYATEPGWDAGIVEISLDENTWTRVPSSQLLRGKFRGEVAPNATEALRGDGSFWGDSRGYQEIIIDLSQYRDQEIFFRFRFLSDANTGATGWWVDNIEMLDLFFYESPAVLTSDLNDNFTAEVGDLGVLVENGMLVDVVDAELGQTSVDVFPNPASETANVRITAERSGAATVRLMTADGRTLAVRQLDLTPGKNQTSFATDQLPAGIYLIQVTGADHVTTSKLTVQ
ncbi:M36 family metallopeptidase [Lewinella sp. 4G2]|uniref:M36 family metallopeptidase n=1 Tax=Lewinella sp. 4G2 TaxID=1803372 RepID=UPI0007B47555|nr:M36 family metallopeptidase [Lewinella sp. 4G2]OAV43304.1 hypothetical protein A3850_001795 [Lewinella sp. 4G2]